MIRRQHEILSIFLCTAFILAGIFTSATTLANNDDYLDPSNIPFITNYKDSVTLSQSVIHREFSWSISRSFADATPLSQLDYKDIEIRSKILTLDLNQVFEINSGWSFKSSIERGKSIQGSAVDSDYSTDNGGLETQAIADVTGSTFYALNFEVSKPIYNEAQQKIDVSMGLNWQSDHFLKQDGYTTTLHGRTLDSTVPIEGLYSRYQANWIGPFIGMGSHFQSQWQTISLNTQLHLLSYSAQGRWNLRNDLQQGTGFRHSAVGIGLHLSADHSVAITQKLHFRQSASLTHFSTFDGTDTLYRTDNSSVSTRLRTARQLDLSYNLGLEFTL